MDEIVAAIKVTSCFRWLIAFLVLYTHHGPWAFHESFWCSKDVYGGQSKINLRRLQQDWLVLLGYRY